MSALNSIFILGQMISLPKAIWRYDIELILPALERVLAGAAVGLHVSCELAALCTAVGAELTFVRFLPGVGAAVHSQVRTVLEHLEMEYS